jgi:DNA-binding NtrC family response regulator
MPHALIIDDDRGSSDLLSRLLEYRGYTATVASSVAEALDNLDPIPDVCLFDPELPGSDNIGQLDTMGEQECQFVFVTERPVDGVVRLPNGQEPTDCLTKPVTRDKLDELFNRLGAGAVTRALSIAAKPGTIIGESPEIKRLMEVMERIGPSDATVLIVGESGTGKELVASRLHALSARASGPCLALNCGAVSPNLIESELFGHERGSFTGALRQHAGYFERANGGTLFLDEVTEMPPDLQVRLLRVLETRRVSRVGSTESFPIDVRVIAATNRDPWAAVREGKLREDLLYRLQVVPIVMPPLRTRKGDVALLARHFLAQLNAAGNTAKVFSPSALQRLERYAWPGNVRELYNAVQRAYILTRGKLISHADVLADASAGALTPQGDGIQISLGESLSAVERKMILHTVRNCRTQDEAARLLGVSTKTLYNKLRLYDAQSRGAPDASGAASTGLARARTWG